MIRSIEFNRDGNIMILNLFIVLMASLFLANALVWVDSFATEQLQIIEDTKKYENAVYQKINNSLKNNSSFEQIKMSVEFECLGTPGNTQSCIYNVLNELKYAGKL